MDKYSWEANGLMAHPDCYNLQDADDAALLPIGWRGKAAVTSKRPRELIHGNARFAEMVYSHS